MVLLDEALSSSSWTSPPPARTHTKGARTPVPNVKDRHSCKTPITGSSIEMANVHHVKVDKPGVIITNRYRLDTLCDSIQIMSESHRGPGNIAEPKQKQRSDYTSASSTSTSKHQSPAVCERGRSPSSIVTWMVGQLIRYRTDRNRCDTTQDTDTNIQDGIQVVEHAESIDVQNNRLLILYFATNQVALLKQSYKLQNQVRQCYP
ncbi:Hypothetical_protein [Hexamita inflata]|uniref:Hypothetical_protein n=1 Tax=Hexamita inflata TaxID=28002 RepID=A0AA86R462_9EUKA|nr:Hypothetical protein HINF_LOCUS58999 [Hexamita inflata]